MRRAFKFLLILAWLILPQAVSAFEVCPDNSVYLKTGEEIVLELPHRKDCNIGFMILERGTVTRRLHYPSGKTDTRKWSAGQKDDPALYSELPSQAYLKAHTEALIKFLAQTPKLPPVEAKAPAPKVRLIEVCGGQTFNLKVGEEFNFRFARECQTPVAGINFNGAVEEHVTYYSGKTDRRTLRTGAFGQYAEWPTRITWKPIAPTQVTFIAKTATARAEPAPRSKPEAQAQKRDQPQSARNPDDKRTTPISDEFFFKSFNVLLLLLYWAGLVYLIVWLSKRTTTAVSAHWYTLIDNLQTSPKEFQASVQQAIETHKIPEIANSRINWKESGLFSAEREYLRIRREKHVFDICAAPFGTGFFISWWFGELRPSAIGPTLAAILVINIIYSGLVYRSGLFRGGIFTIVIVILIFFVLGIVVSRNAGRYWVRYILVIPVFGWLIERFFLPATYYRSDTALMFQESVRRAVEEVIDGITKTKGIRALSELERKPILRDLFQRF